MEIIDYRTDVRNFFIAPEMRARIIRREPGTAATSVQGEGSIPSVERDNTPRASAQRAYLQYRKLRTMLRIQYRTARGSY